jgi:hypothetical protein
MGIVVKEYEVKLEKTSIAITLKAAVEEDR